MKDAVRKGSVARMTMLLGLMVWVGQAVMAAAIDPPSARDNSVPVARAIPSPLLAIDQNRATVIDRIVGEWGEALVKSNAGIDAAQLREMLTGMRADQLLAASLAGSLEGLRNVVAAALVTEAEVKHSLLQAKALGDANQDVVYVPVTPCRLVETRGTFPAVFQGGGAFVGNEIRTYTLQGGNGVCLTQLPASVSPSAIQLQVFGIPTTTGSGDIEILPQGSTFGSTAALVYLGNNAFTSAAVTSLANIANKQISVQVRGGGAHVAIDVVGYFRAPAGGFVSSVTAGTGLTGGTITSSGTIAVDTTVVQSRVTGTCAAGSSIRTINADGTVVCETDDGGAGGGGTVTSVGTGTGLTGGPITASGTVSIAAGGVGATQLASNAVTTVKITDSNVTTAKIADASVTAAKLADGAVTSDKLAGGIASARPMNVTASFQDTGGTGQQSSIVMGADGLPLAAYYDQTNQRLRVMHCDTLDCASKTLTTVDAGPGVGRDPSIMMTVGGVGAISYFDAANTALKVAFCGNAACTTATIDTVDATNDTGHFSSIVSLTNSLILISYYDNTLKDLKLAQCNSTISCNAATILTVTSAGDVGQWSAMTILGNNDIAIAYLDATAHLLRIATCPSFSSCATPALTTVEILGTDVAEGIAITTNQSGNAVVSYVRRAAAGAGNKKVAVCESSACAAPVITPLQSVSSGEPTVTTSVTVTPDGLPVIAMSPNLAGATCDSSSGSSGGGFAKCRTADCASFEIGNSLGVATTPSVTTGSDGYPIATMWGCSTTPASANLKTIHCASMSCQGAFRPR